MPQAPARRAASESSHVAKLVGLHHRRRGWAWVAIGSAIGLAVYVGIDINLFENLTGTVRTLSIVPVFVLLALALAGLVVVIVDTSRIHRADVAARVSAKGSVSPGWSTRRWSKPISRCGSGRAEDQHAPAVPAHKHRSANLVPPLHSALTYSDLVVCLHNDTKRSLWRLWLISRRPASTIVKVAAKR
jgi:hypothetical protein